MKKVPIKAVDEFQSSLKKQIELLSLFEELESFDDSYFAENEYQYDFDQLFTVLVEQAVLSTAVELESFLSELFAYYVTKAPRGLEVHLRDLLAKKYGEHVASKIELNWDETMSSVDARRIFDPEDRNLSFRSAEDLKTQAKKFLEVKHQEIFASLTKEQESILDLWFAVRNFLAHRSGYSRKQLQKVLSNQNLLPVLRLGESSIFDLGEYLLSFPPGSTDNDNPRRHNRIQAMIWELSEIVIALSPEPEKASEAGVHKLVEP